MKKALITGSSRGIGKQVGLDLLSKDYFVYFNGHTHESINQLEKELDMDLSYSIICQDLSTLEGNLDLAENFRIHNIKLDVLVLNLGITDRTPFGAIAYDSWKKVIDVNFSFPFFLVQALANNINEHGKIIFISSISGIIPDSVSISYGVSKGAINILVPYLAKEFSEKQITVNAVAPGYIMTAWQDGKPQDQLDRIANKCLAKRLGTSEEISKAVISIVENNFINGQVIKCDGGFGL